MSLTPRGDKVVATLVVIGIIIGLWVALVVGQNLKRDRLNGPGETPEISEAP